MERSAQIGMALTAFGVSASMFDRVLPKIEDVRNEAVDSREGASLRRRLMRTTGVMLAIGGGVSLLTKSPWPVVGVAGAAVWLVGEYQMAAAEPGKAKEVWR